MINSKGRLEFGVYLLNSLREREGEKGHMWKSKSLFGKIKGPLGKWMEDMTVLW